MKSVVFSLVDNLILLMLGVSGLYLYILASVRARLPFRFAI